MNAHTVDPGLRAASIADRAAEEVWKATGNHDLYCQTWETVYAQALIEFHS